MKTIARALLRWIINYYPKPQLEIGRGMLTELEELYGWKALQWALGGIQFYLELKGVSMFKSILGISSVVILAMLASWLYAQQHLELSIGVLVVGVIVAALVQPKSAFWCSLSFAIILPVTHLTQAYVFSSNMLHELTANVEMVLTSDKTQLTPTYITFDSINSTPNLQITGRLETEATNALKAAYVYGNTTPNNWDEASSLFENQPVKLALFGLPIAFLLAGLTLLLRSRFRKSPPLAM
jgi:hypothetical protein